MGRFVAYSPTDKAFGWTAKEALENLKNIVDGKDKTTLA